MEPQFTVDLPFGNAAFEGTILDGDELPRYAFSVLLSNHPLLYGIWRPKWATNQNDFDVEVVGFGWTSKYNAGNPHPLSRVCLSHAELANTKLLIDTLFRSVEIRKRFVPFSSPIARFLGNIAFTNDWARTVRECSEGRGSAR